MKQLQKSDLKEGEIYKQLDFDYIFLYNKNETSDSFNDGTAISTTAPRYCKRWSGNGFEKPMVETTPEEKHWLKVCIKADKFVSYEDAMKTFIPEYVECIRPKYWLKTIKENNGNLIFKSDFKSSQFVQIIEVLPQSASFKPSTKEAYDAQFVVKKPEFVLSEIWWVRITKENLKDVSKFLNANIGEYTIGFVAGMVKSYKSGAITKGYNSTPTTSYGSTFGNEITYDQFKQYVLKENTIVTEKPKVVLEEPKDKVLAHLIQSDITLIHSVECSEGGIYKIGDKITVFDKYSPNKGKPFIIKSFRWSNDKSKICAVTELHTLNGIGLDKIELYVEPKVKSVLAKNAKLVVDDFVLPEKWCVEVNFEIRNRFGYYEAYGYHHSIQINDTNKWSINIKEGFTEITFEKFKKYVLKDE